MRRSLERLLTPPGDPECPGSLPCAASRRKHPAQARESEPPASVARWVPQVDPTENPHERAIPPPAGARWILLDHGGFPGPPQKTEGPRAPRSHTPANTARRPGIAGSVAVRPDSRPLTRPHKYAGVRIHRSEPGPPLTRYSSRPAMDWARTQFPRTWARSVW